MAFSVKVHTIKGFHKPRRHDAMPPVYIRCGALKRLKRLKWVLIF